MSTKITKDAFPEIIEVYNCEGKTAAYDLIRSQYGIKNPSCVMKRMKTTRELLYDAQADRFELKNCNEEEGIFLNLETLCDKQKRTVYKNHETQKLADRTTSMEKLIQTLINERLLEISKYVILDPIGHQIIVDKTAMAQAGYKVCIS